MTIAAADQGTGATIAFGTSSFSAYFTMIGGTEFTREDIEITYLGTTGAKRFAPADLYDPGEFDVEFQYDADSQLPYTAAPETVTITFPLITGYNTGATLAGTAYVKSFSTPELRANQLMVAKGKIRWSGATAPAFTDHT